MTGTTGPVAPIRPAESASINIGAGTTGTGANAASIDPRVRTAQQGLSSESAALAEAQALARSEFGNSGAMNATRSETDDQIVNRIAVGLGVPRELLLRTVADHLVWVLDQVHVPGVYVAAEGTTLPEMIAAAGGGNIQADLSSVEVTSTEFDRIAGLSHTSRNSYVVSDERFRTASIRPLDVVRLRQVYADRTGETITVAGQVRYPGVFDITRDERLSSVLQRAGGMTEVAYPYGTIFTRRSVAIHEREGNDRSARELQSQLAVLLSTPSRAASVDQSGVAYLSTMVSEIRNAPTLGRITVTADPVVLAARPELDLILEPGDAIFVPKRPSTVTVSGEVLNPGSFQFRSSYGLDDYVRLAGGPNQAADSGDTFVVLPDGSAAPTSDSWVSFGNGGHIPPGSTIVVPRDLRPFDWSTFLRDTTQIVSQLAIAGASLAVLQNNH
ncbi:MAG: SLBB domain-containing protein [Rhizomicrobium sp.]